MLKNRKKVNKFKNIIIVFIVMVMTIGLFTNIVQAIDTITIDRGEIDPFYRPEWAIDKNSDGSNRVEISSENGTTMKITVKGTTYKTEVVNSDLTLNYSSIIESDLTADDITVYVNGVEEEGITKSVSMGRGLNVTLYGDANCDGNVTIGDTTSILQIINGTAENVTEAGLANADVNLDGIIDEEDVYLVLEYMNGTRIQLPAIKSKVLYEITLTNLEEAVRRTGIPYKELSGNIQIKIGGRGQDPSTYNSNTIKDEYGNHSMMETDQNEDGTWLDVTFGDNETNHNTDNVMFADFIKPEFTYEYANTTIGSGPSGNKKVSVIFDVTDKYFSNTTLTSDQITVKVSDEEVNGTVNVTKTLTKQKDIIINTATNAVTYQEPGYTLQTNERKVGERYELLVEGLEQLDENGLSNGYTYSGPMTIAFPSGKVTDLSGNVNNATTITIGVDEPATSTNEAEIVDVVDPIWELGDIDTTNKTVKLRAKDKYFDRTEITTANITVYVNGIESTLVGKDITSIAPTDITDTVDGVQKVVGKEYTLQLSNVAVDGGTGETGYVDFVPTNLTTDGLNNNAGFKYRNENGGSIDIKISSGTIYDESGNVNREQEFTIGIIDETKPEIYEVQKTQNATIKTETIVFNVIDKNYDSTDLIEENEITVWVDGEQVDNISKSITIVKPIKHDIDGETDKIIGHQYTVVLSNMVEETKQTGKSYLEWSGKTQIKIAENAAKDIKGNTLDTGTTTISDFIDYIKPEMKPETVTSPIDRENKTYTMSFSIIDKYFDTANMLTDAEVANKIKVYVDGEEATSITKTITKTPITANFNKTVEGTATGETTYGTYTIGYTYTLVLSDFEQTLKQTGKNFMEWSGTVKIEIDKDVVVDTKGNTLEQDVTKRTVNGEQVDFIKPVIEKVSSTVDTTNKTETIVFNIFDKYLNTSDVLTEDEIKVYLDKDLTEGITKTLTKVRDFTANVNENTTHLVGQQYRLVLSDFKQVSNSAENYTNWSGTVEIEITEDAIKDTSNNNLAEEVEKRTIVGDFVDFVKPEIRYRYQTSDIDYENKTYTMTIDATDKYYTSGEISLNDITILMKNGQKDANENEIVNDLKQLATDGKINITFSKANKMATFRKTVSGAIEETATEHVIGHTYTLTISNLEQLEIAEGRTTADYSGIITVAVAENVIKDNGPTGNGTNPNGNVGTTITSIAEIPSGVGSESTLPSTAYTTPYLPTGYSYVEGTIDTGLTIQDSLGNQYVWVEVPKTTTVYPTAGLAITEFTDTEYTAIENDLHTYTSVYRNSTSFTDTWYSEDQHGLTETEYNELKKKMLKSVYQNGGFYVGKYETGIDYNDPNGYRTRTASGEITQTPVIKQNAYVYNFVTNKQAQTLASSMASGNYTSSLMFGVQWDLVLKYMETKGATQSELNSDSTSWGNYPNSQYTVSNTSAKYSTDDGYTYTSAPYTKTADADVLLTTGASSEFNKAGIYDLAGNVIEKTLENTNESGLHSSSRGGDCDSIGTHSTTSDSAGWRLAYRTFDEWGDPRLL